MNIKKLSAKTVLLLVVTLASLFGAVSTMAADTVWIDVRTDQEWNDGHLAAASHIPYTEIASKIASITEDKNAPIKLYCKSGGRAGKAKQSLEEMGYTNVENLGGLSDAEKAYAKAQAE